MPLGQDVRGAAQYLKSSGSAKVAVTGFCMGGALTLLAVVNVPELNAAVVWYGVPPIEYVDASKIKNSLLGEHFAIHDTAFPIAKVDEPRTETAAGGGSLRGFIATDAKHAFANETADSKNLSFLKYDAKAAELAWRRTMDFLARNLPTRNQQILG